MANKWTYKVYKNKYGLNKFTIEGHNFTTNHKNETALALAEYILIR